MDEYIEKNKAIKELYEVYDYEFPTASGAFDEYARMIVPNTIKNMPAADVAPVRHGRWKEMHYEGGILDGTNFDRCSICGYERVFDDPALKTVFKYFPNCGAKMDGAE